MERRVEPLVMPSEIQRAAASARLVKADNLVVPFSFPYIELPKEQAASSSEKKPQQLKEKSTLGTTAPPSSVPAYEQRPREIEPMAEKTKAAAANSNSNEQQPFFE